MKKKKASIMIVDQDAPAREALAALLAGRYCSRIAATAEEAIGILAFWNFDLVITDRELPGISGFALAQFIKSKSRDTAVIILSDSMSQWDKSLAEWLGVFECIGKPCNPSNLLGLIETALLHKAQKAGPAIADSVQLVYQIT